MKANVFSLNPKITYGEGVSLNAGKELKELNVSRVMLVTDKGILDANICDEIVSSIKEEGIDLEIFSGVETNPTEKHVAKAINFFNENFRDGIIAIGGGSSLDVAKSVAVVIGNGGEIEDYEDGKKSAKKTSPPLILIPTTAGTGSEVVGGTIITHTERKFKMHIVATPAHVALCDPLLTTKLPPNLTAATGLDALSHAIGAYVSVERQPLTDAMALYSIEKINHWLLESVFRNTPESRSNMMLASMTAGISMKGGGSGEHAFAHGVNSLFNVHHGVACAIFLADVMEHNLEDCKDRYADIAKALGIDVNSLSSKEAALEGIRKVRALVKEAEIPELQDLNITADDIPEITNKVLEDQFHLGLNPVPIDQQDIESILLKHFN